MDNQTKRIVEALDSGGVEVLLVLLAGAATEATIVGAITGAKQPTVHRRLVRLADAGLVAHEAGTPHTPGLLWRVRHQQELDAVLQRFFDLANAVAEAERAEREVAERQLRQARAARLGIHDVGDAAS
jgi:transcription initiation factor IIE alpha subunit